METAQKRENLDVVISFELQKQSHLNHIYHGLFSEVNQFLSPSLLFSLPSLFLPSSFSFLFFTRCFEAKHPKNFFPRF